MAQRGAATAEGQGLATALVGVATEVVLGQRATVAGVARVRVVRGAAATVHPTAGRGPWAEAMMTFLTGTTAMEPRTPRTPHT